MEARTFAGRKRNYVSTAGRDEATIREHIRNQEKEDQRLDQLEMFNRGWPPSGGSQPK